MDQRLTDRQNRIESFYQTKILNARAMYLRSAAQSPNLITPQQFRVLFLLADFADADLGNCFPRVSSLAQQLGVGRRTALHHLNGLTGPEGWLRAYPCFRSNDGGRASSLYQFQLPTAAPGGPWKGPVTLSNRENIKLGTPP